MLTQRSPASFMLVFVKYTKRIKSLHPLLNLLFWEYCTINIATCWKSIKNVSIWQILLSLLVGLDKLSSHVSNSYKSFIFFILMTPLEEGQCALCCTVNSWIVVFLKTKANGCQHTCKTTIMNINKRSCHQGRNVEVVPHQMFFELQFYFRPPRCAVGSQMRPQLEQQFKRGHRRWVKYSFSPKYINMLRFHRI